MRSQGPSVRGFDYEYTQAFPEELFSSNTLGRGRSLFLEVRNSLRAQDKVEKAIDYGQRKEKNCIKG